MSKLHIPRERLHQSFYYPEATESNWKEITCSGVWITGSNGGILKEDPSSGPSFLTPSPPANQNHSIAANTDATKTVTMQFETKEIKAGKALEQIIQELNYHGFSRVLENLRVAINSSSGLEHIAQEMDSIGFKNMAATLREVAVDMGWGK